MSASDLSDLLDGPKGGQKPGIVQRWVDSLDDAQRENFYTLLADPRWKTQTLWRELSERGAPFGGDRFHIYRNEWRKRQEANS